jgi:hypothetical protein
MRLSAVDFVGRMGIMGWKFKLKKRDEEDELASENGGEYSLLFFMRALSYSGPRSQSGKRSSDHAQKSVLSC